MDGDTNDGIDRTAKDPETYELAFELWSWVCNRNGARVSHLLAGDDYGNRQVTARTIQRWAVDDNWPERQRDRLTDLLPDMVNQVISNFAQIALEGSHLLVKRLRQDGTTVPQQKDPLTGQPLTTVEVAVDKTLVAATFNAADRLGLSPLGKTTAPELRKRAGDAVAKALPDLAGKSADELESLLRQQMEG